MGHINIAAQIIGFIGVVLFVLSFQIKSNKKLFFVQIMANVMFAIQFVMLGAYSGCVGLIICILRNVVFIYRDRWEFANSKAMLAIMLGCCVLNTIVNWKGWYDLFSMLAVSSASIGYWIGSARALRTSNLFAASPCWIIYDVVVGSWAGVLNETIAIVSILVSVVRFGWKALGESGEEFK